VATALGAFLALTPAAIMLAAVVWIVIVAAFRYVSLASRLASVTLPLGGWILGYPSIYAASAACAAALILWRHHENVKRLLSGTPPRAAGEHRRISGAGLALHVSAGPAAVIRPAAEGRRWPCSSAGVASRCGSGSRSGARARHGRTRENRPTFPMCASRTVSFSRRARRGARGLLARGPRCAVSLPPRCPRADGGRGPPRQCCSRDQGPRAIERAAHVELVDGSCPATRSPPCPGPSFAREVAAGLPRLSSSRRPTRLWRGGSRG
jgi:hypothetical protein